MSADFLDSQAHYQHERELGHNRAGGRAGYLPGDRPADSATCRHQTILVC